MKMKRLVFLIVMFTSFLWAVRAENEVGIPKSMFWTKVKNVDSDGKNVSTPSNEHHRSIRWASNCEYPLHMEDGELDCVKSASKIECTHSCMFGHKLSKGVQRQMWCYYGDGRWQPKPYFEKCLPFIDCSLTLKSNVGGMYKCNKNFMHRGPVCRIACKRDRNKPRVPMRQYECDINGQWRPKLPHCVESKGINLVSPPRGSWYETND